MKNKKTLILVILLILVLVSALIIAAFSYARYLSIINADGTAVVARWNFNATNIEGTTLTTVALTDTTLNSKVVDGKIAPGTDGSFAIVVDASGSEVALTYDIEIFNFSDSMPENLKFYSSNVFTPENELTLIDGKIVFSGEIALADVNTPVITTLYWAWAYQTEDGDEQDTLDGIAAGTATFDIKITGIQMDPNYASLEKYTITHVAEDGAGRTGSLGLVPSTSKKTQTREYTITSEVPTLGANSVFRNWNTEADGSGLSYESGATYTSDEPLTLYAMWDFVVPSGFNIVVGDTSNLNAGVVIEDGNGNQFVWVPVADQGLEYSKLTGEYTTTITADGTTDDGLPGDITSEQTQINKYGGFYIARYEAGIPTSIATTHTIEAEMIAARNVAGVPVSKQNQVPWNYIDYNNAQANAESMYSNNVIQSGLITGTQWDVVMKWLETGSRYNVRTDSSAFGNYNNTSFTSSAMDNTGPYGNSWNDGTTTVDEYEYALFKTGSAATVSNNIYDIAGNVWEWTNEMYSSYHNLRSGDFAAYSYTQPAAIRTYAEASLTIHFLGFRVVLYLK
jgi:hypothetical protein